MRATKLHGLRVAVWLVWTSLAVLLLSMAVPSFVGAAAASPGPPPSFAPSASGTSSPLAPAADPADPPSSTPTLVATVGVGTQPLRGATDLANGWVYVANARSNSVTVLNGTTVVATVALPNAVGTPDYVVYDAANGYVYVVDTFYFEGTGGAVSVLNNTSVLATVGVGPSPDAAVVDRSTGDVYVANCGGANVSVVSGESEIASVPVGTSPCSLALDPVSDEVYVANEGSGNVSVLSGLGVLGQVTVGSSPDAVAFDPADSELYVANNVSENVTVLSGLTVVGNVPVGADPSFASFNAYLGAVEVANTNSSTVSVLNGSAVVATLPVTGDPVWVGPGLTGGFAFVAGWSTNAVTILNATTTLRNVTVGALPTYGIADPVNQLMYIVDSGGNNVSVFAVGYSVTFNETGLAPSVAWSVTLGASSNSSTTPLIGFLEPAGVYTYAVATPSGYELVSSTPSSPLTVTDAPIVVNVTFAPLPTATYTLTFVETGLSGCHTSGGGGWGSPWSAPRGDWGSQGSPQCCHSSIPSWSVTVEGVTKSTTNTSLSFSEPNGTFSYTVDAPSGYVVAASVPASPVTIDGANVTVAVTFSRCTTSVALSITFEESGLPRWTTWCVTLNVTACSSGEEIVFSGLSPGSYGFNVSPVKGYTAHPEVGTVRLSTYSVTVNVRFWSAGHHHGGCGGWQGEGW